MNIEDRTDKPFDLIVVGGGPAGSTLATFVRNQGHRVALLEREQFPRHQIGESLLPATVHGICRLLNIADELSRAGFVVKPGASFRWGRNPNLWGFRFRRNDSVPEAIGYSYQVDRAKFDHILLNNARRAGVDVRERHTVTEVVLEGDGRVTGVRYTDEFGKPGELRTRFVADASGNTSRIHRAAGERLYSDFFQNVAIYTYFENAKRLPPPDEGNTLSAAFDHGWFWLIPLSETLTSVGAVVPKEFAKEFSEGPETVFQRFVQACPIIANYLEGATRVSEGMFAPLRIRKDYSYANTRLSSPGLVLIGDAACFVDPIFSSGVHLATYSALIAARSINTCLAGILPEHRCFEEFERRYRREFNHFYNFNIGFYDMNQDEEAYYWKARSVLGTPERANDAFVRLVSGSAAEDFFDARVGIGAVLQKHTEQVAHPVAAAGFNPSKFDVYEFSRNIVEEGYQIERQAGMRPRTDEKPLFAGGLVPSADGFHWSEAEASVRQAAV